MKPVPLHPLLDALAWEGRLTAARHDAGVFADYFLTPHATPVRAATLLAWLRTEGLDVVAYEAWGNVHGMLARRRGGGGPA